MAAVRNRSDGAPAVTKSRRGLFSSWTAERRKAMLTRILAVALAVGSIAFATAHAQTGGTGSTTTSPSTTSPGTAPMTSPSPGSSGSSGSMGTGSGSSQQAQQPMGTFDASKYKSKTDCLSAAAAAHASSSLCNSLK
jgi:hypothetical protein